MTTYILRFLGVQLLEYSHITLLKVLGDMLVALGLSLGLPCHVLGIVDLMLVHFEFAIQKLDLLLKSIDLCEHFLGLVLGDLSLGEDIVVLHFNLPIFLEQQGLRLLKIVDRSLEHFILIRAGFVCLHHVLHLKRFHF